MAKAENQQVLDVECGTLFKAITDLLEYPKFVTGCKNAEIVPGASAGFTRVKYSVRLIKDVTYTLNHLADEAQGKMNWSLVESEFLKMNSGFWEIKSAGPGKTDVKYGLEIEFKIPVPSMILGRLVKSNLPEMLKEFEKRAKLLEKRG